MEYRKNILSRLEKEAGKPLNPTVQSQLDNLKSWASQNAQERLDIIKEAQELFSDKGLRKLADSVDASFIRKLYNWPGDITGARVSTVIDKIFQKLGI